MRSLKRYFWPLALAFCLIAGSVDANCAPRVKAVLLYNFGSGKILYQHNANLKIAPASLTKIMTMFLAMDAIKAKRLTYSQKIRVGKEAAAAGGSSMVLHPGERAPVVRLLAGMAVASGNDAATAMAIHLGGNTQNFTAMMNRKAQQLGMASTKFKNPTGLPAPGQKTTANDLLSLCRAYLRAHPEAMRFHKMLYFMHKGRVARNTNPLLGVIPGVNGLKTGWTVASGYNLIITAERKKTRLLAIVLGGSSKADRDAMAIRMLQAGFQYPNDPAMARKFIDAKQDYSKALQGGARANRPEGRGLEPQRNLRINR